MSPIADPRFTKARKEGMATDGRSTTSEYLIPLVMLGGGGLIMMIWMGVNFGGIAAALYPVILAIEVVLGMVGLFVAASLFLGGAGPLGLGFIRLAGIYVCTDALRLVTAEWSIIGWIIVCITYLCLLAWLFDFEWMDALVVALITFLIKFFVGAALLMTLMSMAT